MKSLFNAVSIFVLLTASMPAFSNAFVCTEVAVSVVSGILYDITQAASSSTNGQGGEDLRIVRDDAIRSLAGEEPTDRLVETISILRESSDELAMYSDEEMEMLIVEAVAI